MIIIVEGHLIETKEIWDIADAPHRMHGFIIKILGPKEIIIGKPQQYDVSNSTVQGINDTYRKLKEAVIEKWKSDKTEIPVFKL